MYLLPSNSYRYSRDRITVFNGYTFRDRNKNTAQKTQIKLTMSADLKPGQKFPTPTPGFGDRVFYETLYRQRPDSAMAQEW
jgi:hypothetical protein